MAAPGIDDKLDRELKEKLESFTQRQRTTKTTAENLTIDEPEPQRPINTQSNTPDNNGNKFESETPASEPEEIQEPQFGDVEESPEGKTVEQLENEGRPKENDEEGDEDENPEDGTEQDQEKAEDEEAAQERLEMIKNAARKNAVAAEEATLAAEEGAVAAESGQAAAGFLAATSEFWVPILGLFLLVLLVIGIFFFVSTSAIAYCNQDGLSGWTVWGASKISALAGGEDYCATIKIAGGGRSGGGGASTSFPAPSGPNLVNLSSYGVQVKAGIDDRVTACMAARVQQLYQAALSARIDIEITDAYRPGGTTAGGGTSAHSRGEAVDIALRNPTVPIPLQSVDPRIAKLVAIARAAGFVPPLADTLDEYNNPAPNATAGHVHVEFNIPPNGGTYCT